MKSSTHKFLLTLWSFMAVFVSLCSKASLVEVKKNQQGFYLQVDGKAFAVKGAGINYPDGHNFAALKQAGGNAFRTWSTKHAKQELAKAKELGLMVLMGIDLKKQLHGFDYNDKQAVAKQFEWVKKQVLEYKDHPNLLGWVVANEPNLLFAVDGSLAMVNPKVYQAISDIINFIHEVDPKHPVTYSFAGVIPEHIHTAMTYTPQVDFISVQTYGELEHLQRDISALNIDKAFMVTEFGPMGHWEQPATSWGREIEEPSGVKARSFAKRIQQGIANNSSQQLIGHFAFEWGQKQERTPTWYGMFNKDGKASARIDELTKFWMGSYPENRAPAVGSILLNNQKAEQSVKVTAGSQLEVQVTFVEPDSDKVNINWQFMKEVTTRSQGGAFEQEPETIPVNLIQQSIKPLAKDKQLLAANIKAPAATGEYRLFVYIDDGKDKVGNANFPFYVKNK